MTAHEEAVLAYYTRENAGHVELVPLAGLSLNQFRIARQGLVARGVLVKSLRGRYVPAQLQTAAA